MTRPTQRLDASDIAIVTEEDPIHPVVVRGGHSLYCVTCDRDVAHLASPARGIARADKTHEREVRALLRPGLNVRWDLSA